mmetsp:Transcript_99375/g.301659  ORF Transcript_99375/g.301659 Transcript_99375/m.301659 type:complete len:211 (-) Transcript_99375:35-667(-)
MRPNRRLGRTCHPQGRQRGLRDARCPGNCSRPPMSPSQLPVRGPAPPAQLPSSSRSLLTTSSCVLCAWRPPRPTPSYRAAIGACARRAALECWQAPRPRAPFAARRPASCCKFLSELVGWGTPTWPHSVPGSQLLFQAQVDSRETDCAKLFNACAICTREVLVRSTGVLLPRASTTRRKREPRAAPGAGGASARGGSPKRRRPRNRPAAG